MGLFYSTGEEKQKEQKSSDGGGVDSEWLWVNISFRKM